MEVLVVVVVRATIHRLPDGHIFTINCTMTVMVLLLSAIVIGDDHPVFRNGRS